MNPVIALEDRIQHSILPSVQWPPVLDIDASRLLLLLDYIERESQWLAKKELQQQQFNQLLTLFTHAKATVPFYVKHWRRVPKCASPDALHALWKKIPLIDVSYLIAHNDQLYSTSTPRAHGVLKSVSCNIPQSPKDVLVLKNNAVELMNNLYLIREYVWHQRNFKAMAARISFSPQETCVTSNDWGPPFANVIKTGQMQVITAPTAEQLHNTLQQYKPQYLLCTTHTWSILLDYYRTHPFINWGVEEIIIEDSLISAEMRQLTLKHVATPISDRYSRPECGIIALRCPEFSSLHVQAEHVLVELTDAKGAPCPKGMPGYITITPLHNFSSPLIRYQTNDRGVWANPCPCDRTLPVIKTDKEY